MALGLPTAEQGLVAYEAIRRHAKSMRAAGDGRSTGQLMADTFAERLTGTDCAKPSNVNLNLVMADTTLLGLDDKPAQLAGGGPSRPSLRARS